MPSARPDRLVLFLPLKPNRRAGRKFLIAPDGATVPAAETSERLTTMQRALGRAFFWRREIESGKYEGLRDFARKNRLGEDYVYRQITLTLLAPSIVEGILAGTLPRHATLQQLYGVAQMELWEEQTGKIFSAQ